MLLDMQYHMSMLSYLLYVQHDTGCLPYAHRRSLINLFFFSWRWINIHADQTHPKGLSFRCIVQILTETILKMARITLYGERYHEQSEYPNSIDTQMQHCRRSLISEYNKSGLDCRGYKILYGYIFFKLILRSKCDVLIHPYLVQ